MNLQQKKQEKLIQIISKVVDNYNKEMLSEVIKRGLRLKWQQGRRK